MGRSTVILVQGQQERGERDGCVRSDKDGGGAVQDQGSVSRSSGRLDYWEGIVSRPISWSDLWKIPQARLNFLIRSTYDTFPCPHNLHQWFGNEECCPLYNSPNASFRHILSGCKTVLSQGHYRWRHDQVLKKLAETVEVCRQATNSGCSPATKHRIQFVRQKAPA
ncbi:hypothetical protein AAFF_G00287680 [Aldrovandia affinis]|uniref:Reverse transcriptase zinc-binding domain-containing protein n=1 Tax=Aldrovandia affinis TaxID=143900 RepID=A0AAD7SRY5_9TELE|nr:hypothetical protein AAFF_G00287680 [Aldrovandia affinis]